jgi:RimJ/RimL family protein N-acetyltransferase
MDSSPIVLRPLAVTDVDSIMTWVNDQDVVGNLAAFAGAPLSRADELAWIERTLAGSDRVYSVFARADDRYLGQIGIHQIHARSRVGRLGAVIARRDDHGKGYGSAAVRAVLDIAFGELALHKLWLMVFAHNTRGRRLYARLGFHEEGVLREEYFHDGRWHDMVRMGRLASDSVFS